MTFRQTASSLLALGIATLSACQPPATETAKPGEAAPPAETAAAETGCNVHVEKAWIDQETPVRRYTSEASVIGPTCQQGVAVLVIRQREGTPIYTWSGLVDYLFGLRDAADPAAMKTALNDWINQGNPAENTTATLPPWEETEGQPKRAEFPFMPAEGIDKAAWDQLKKDNLDMFCFPQGMESNSCAVLRPGTDGAPTSMEEIGLQLFPG
jgi:hypothetical protein